MMYRMPSSYFQIHNSTHKFDKGLTVHMQVLCITISLKKI